jgi:ribosomal protein L27
MATSPNYGWSEPDNTSLVKDGALAMRTLGNAIDTSVWNVGYGQAGKNKIINGDFGVWQRGTTFTPSVGVLTYTADRFFVVLPSGSTVSRQTFTPGTAPVAGYEGQFYLNVTNTANAQNYEAGQRIENARTFAGQTVTFSFWARSTVGAQTMNILLQQNFGTGGSPSATVDGTLVASSTGTAQYTPTGTWTRYWFTYSLPSVSGKTFGTNNNSYLQVRPFQYTATTTNTSLDIWGVQLEYGSLATPFQTASGGSIQGELAMCQRYYYAHSVGSNVNVGLSNYTLSSELHTAVQFPVTMRTAPSLDQVTGTNYYAAFTAGVTDTFDALIISRASATSTQLYQTGATVSGTAGTAGILYTNNAATRLAFTAEL